MEAQTLSTLRQNQREQICHFVFRAGHGDALSWSNDSAHRWWPLRGARIVNRRCGAAIRCSAWFGILGPV